MLTRIVYSRKKLTILLLFLVMLSGCGKHGQDRSNIPVSDEDSAVRVVEAVLSERNTYMKQILTDLSEHAGEQSAAFRDRSDIINGLEAFYSEEQAQLFCDEWLCADIGNHELYQMNEDGTVRVCADPVLFLVSEQYEISVLSYSPESIEALAVFRTAGNTQSGIWQRGMEVLTIRKLEQGWRICGAKSGAITDYLVNEETEERQVEEGSISAEEANEIVSELYERWGDFENRVYGPQENCKESAPMSGYVICPPEVFSSMEDILNSLNQLVTPPCAEQYADKWLHRNEFPQFVEQDGILYRADAFSPNLLNLPAERIVLWEYDSSQIRACIFQMEEIDTNGQTVMELTLRNTPDGWRIESVWHGSIDKSTEEYIFPVYYSVQYL